jgi:O-antigen/teichoic acid export membrane protein
MENPLPAAVEVERVAAKAVLGVLALGGRQLFVHSINLAGNVMLARLLSPADFGVYAVVIFLISFLSVFGGTGLASNLIRSLHVPSEREYAAIFTAQQTALCLVTAGLILAAPKLTHLYHLPSSYLWLFCLAAVALLLTSFTVVPQIKLERELAFSKLAVAEVWQAAIFNLCAVGLAWKGFGALSFAIALVARSLTGVIAVYSVEPWMPRWHWDNQLIRKNLWFGIFFQFSQILSLAKDAITPLLLGLLLGAATVGYTSWASMLASYPVLALMILQRVYLPMFARLQHEPDGLCKFVEKVIFATNLLAAPIAVFILALIFPITSLIYGSKWYMAIPLFELFWITNLFSPTATPLLGLLNALGFSRITFGFTACWMALTWALGVPLVMHMGVMGLAWANVIVQISNVALFLVAKRKLPIRILPSLIPGWILAALVGSLMWLGNHFYPIHSIAMLLAYLTGSGVVFFACVIFRHRHEVQQMGSLIRARSVVT